MARRRHLLLLAFAPAATVLAQGDGQRLRRKIPAAELLRAASARFPQRFGPPGLLELQVSAPRLLLLPSRNKIGLSLAADVAGRGARDSISGELDLVFGVRWEASDRTLRARDPEVLDVRIPAMAPEGIEVLRAVLPRVARESLGEWVLHAFSPRELALADTMGFEPETLTVEHDGLVVEFRPKAFR